MQPTFRMLILLVISTCISACSLFQSSQRNSDPYRPYTIYYGGQEVGTSTFESILVPGTVGRTYRDFVTEEIDYFGSRYKFEFVIEGEVQNIKILRYSAGTDQLILGNSYRLEIDGNTVRRTYYDENGNTANTRVIQSRQMIEHTESIFRLSTQFINSYYLAKSIEERRSIKMPSLGYQLLIQDRL